MLEKKPLVTKTPLLIFKTCICREHRTNTRPSASHPLDGQPGRGEMGDVGTVFFPSGCENDSLPLVSSDGVKTECLRGALSGRGIAPNCYSSSVSLPASICLPLSVRPSVLLALCPLQALCVCSPAQCSLCGDLMPVRAFSLLVLCIALRKCSTPCSAGSGSEDGEGGG